MAAVGYMPMPDDFKYKSVAERGKPGPSLKHPLMDAGHRAKIFAPFAALRGFDQAILSKDQKLLRTRRERDLLPTNRLPSHAVHLLWRL